MSRERKIVYRGIKDSTCNGQQVVELAEHATITYNYQTMSNKDISYRQKSLDKTIARKKRMLGIVEEEPTMEYFWSFMGQEQHVDECRAKDLIIKGITVYTKDNDGNKHSVTFDGLKLIINK